MAGGKIGGFLDKNQEESVSGREIRMDAKLGDVSFLQDHVERQHRPLPLTSRPRVSTQDYMERHVPSLRQEMKREVKQSNNCLLPNCHQGSQVFSSDAEQRTRK